MRRMKEEEQCGNEEWCGDGVVKKMVRGIDEKGKIEQKTTPGVAWIRKVEKARGEQ